MHPSSAIGGRTFPLLPKHLHVKGCRANQPWKFSAVALSASDHSERVALALGALATVRRTAWHDRQIKVDGRDVEVGMAVEVGLVDVRAVRVTQRRQRHRWSPLTVPVSPGPQCSAQVLGWNI